MSGTLERVRRRRSEPGDERRTKRRPHPEGPTSARSDSGRAMSGRIGMSFASTVSSVMDVPDTQSSGVDFTCPA
jgi:hypothetical protein